MFQDVRGRYRSEGKWRPIRDDGPDGADLLKWIGEQPWSNGKVGTVEMYPTSLVFRRGHRIRLDISSSNFPRFDVNPQTPASRSIKTGAGELPTTLCTTTCSIYRASSCRSFFYRGRVRQPGDDGRRGFDLGEKDQVRPNKALHPTVADATLIGRG